MLGVAVLPRVVEINDANTPGVGELALAELQKDLKNSLHALAIDNEHGQVYAFCVEFGTDVDANYQNRGLGALLYQTVEQRMLNSGEHSLLCCEVNLEPPNPGSLRFHKRIGFTEVGQRGDGNAYRVVLLARTLRQM